MIGIMLTVMLMAIITVASLVTVVGLATILLMIGELISTQLKR